MKSFAEYLSAINLLTQSNIIVHASFKKIISSFPGIRPEEVINILKYVITTSGSIMFPTFTYCYKKLNLNSEIFDRQNSKSKVGLLSEYFRASEGVKRTSSPTHSFALWGKILKEMGNENSPLSPLGDESVLDWLTKSDNSFVLLLGTDFTKLTYGHYLEIKAKVPWYNYFPWNYLNLLPIGVSTEGETNLIEIPGCSKGFINFEQYLLNQNLISKHIYNELDGYLINIQSLYQHGIKYFTNNFERLLCPKNTCPACESRRAKFL